MKLVVNEQKENVIAHVGDVIITENDNSYLVIQDSERGIIAKNFEGSTGLHGFHDTIQEFNEHLTQVIMEYTICQKEEYQLTLTKRGDK